MQLKITPVNLSGNIINRQEEPATVPVEDTTIDVVEDTTHTVEEPATVPYEDTTISSPSVSASSNEEPVTEVNEENIRSKGENPLIKFVDKCVDKCIEVTKSAINNGLGCFYTGLSSSLGMIESILDSGIHCIAEFINNSNIQKWYDDYKAGQKGLYSNTGGYPSNPSNYNIPSLPGTFGSLDDNIERFNEAHSPDHIDENGYPSYYNNSLTFMAPFLNFIGTDWTDKFLRNIFTSTGTIDNVEESAFHTDGALFKAITSIAKHVPIIIVGFFTPTTGAKSMAARALISMLIDLGFYDQSYYQTAVFQALQKEANKEFDSIELSEEELSLIRNMLNGNKDIEGLSDDELKEFLRVINASNYYEKNKDGYYLDDTELLGNIYAGTELQVLLDILAIIIMGKTDTTSNWQIAETAAKAGLSETINTIVTGDFNEKSFIIRVMSSVFVSSAFREVEQLLPVVKGITGSEIDRDTSYLDAVKGISGDDVDFFVACICEDKTFMNSLKALGISNPEEYFKNVVEDIRTGVYG